MLGVVEAARTAVEPREGDKTFCGQGVRELLPDGAVHHVVHLLDILEDEGQRQDVGGRDDLAHRAHVEVCEVQAAVAHLFDGVGLIAENGVVVNLGFDPATRLVRHFLGEGFERDGVRVILGVNVPATPLVGQGRSGDQGGDGA